MLLKKINIYVRWNPGTEGSLVKTEGSFVKGKGWQSHLQLLSAARDYPPRGGWPERLESILWAAWYLHLEFLLDSRDSHKCEDVLKQLDWIQNPARYPKTEKCKVQVTALLQRMDQRL